jgi:hypothetical protein
MKEVTEKNFGVIIAFWLPGFLFMWGLSYSLPSVAAWLATAKDDAPTVGGFLYASLASLALGLVINAIRWALVQELLLYGVTRLARPRINFGNLTNKDVLAAFTGAIENNYRYYQYYANALVALIGAVTCYLRYGISPLSWIVWALVGTTAFILFLACRNELKAFNERATAITN